MLLCATELFYRGETQRADTQPVDSRDEAVARGTQIVKGTISSPVYHPYEKIPSLAVANIEDLT
jgi:hypothetical protein